MNTTLLDPNKAKQAKKLIIALSIVIPVVVAILFKVKIEGFDFSILPLKNSYNSDNSNCDFPVFGLPTINKLSLHLI